MTKDEEKIRRRELKEFIKESYKSATKKEFYKLKPDITDNEKTFVGLLAYGDKLKKDLGSLTNEEIESKYVEKKNLLFEYKVCLTIYDNAIGFSEYNPEKLMMVEKRFNRLGKSIFDMVEKGKLPTEYEQDYLRIAEDAIKSAQKVKYLLNSEK